MRSRGFSLLEVMVALAILALSLGVIITGNVNAITSVERIEGMSTSTLLARAKLLDLERELNKEGFKVDEEEREGDFSDEGYPNIKWAARILPIKVQTEKLAEMVTQFAGGGASSEGGATDSAAGLFGGAGDPMQMIMPFVSPVADSIGQNMRLVDLEVSWPEGKGRGKFNVSAIMTTKALKQVTPQLGMPGVGGATGLTGAAKQAITPPVPQPPGGFPR